MNMTYWKNKKVLVTGGAGFVGSHLVDAYIAQGNEVVVVDDLSTGKQRNIDPRAKFYHLSILDQQLDEVFNSEKIDLISHHAAQTSVRNSVADPAFDAQLNVLGTIKLLELSVKYGVKKFIFASTGGAIYGEQNYYPADENHPLRPLSPYGTSKLAAEKYLWLYNVNHGLDTIILRYANVYGPRQDPYGEAGVVAIFTQKILNAEQPIINGNGEQTRDFVSVSDVVRANLMAESLKGCQTINIGTSTEVTITSLFDKLAAISQVKVHRVYGPALPGEQLRSVLNYKRAQKLLGWEPQVSLENGLREVFEFFKGD